MDSSYGSYGHQLMDHQRLHSDPRDYDPRGLHPGSSSHQSLMVGEDLRHHGGHLGGWGGGGEHHQHHQHASSASPTGSVKTTSAFSPLQSTSLMSAAASPGGFAMSNHAARGYAAAFYDPLPFPQPPSKVNFGDPSSSSSSGHASFAGPQLLSLSKIRNYAHNPHNEGGLFKSLSSLAQDKGLNHQLGQLGAAQ
jgi:hypothetical protein